MNAQEKQYFESLHKDRSESADMLEKPSMRGIKNSVVEKYSDQAHFIYELLQNADDAHATTARFVLERDRLILLIMARVIFLCLTRQQRMLILKMALWVISMQ